MNSTKLYRKPKKRFKLWEKIRELDAAGMRLDLPLELRYKFIADGLLDFIAHRTLETLVDGQEINLQYLDSLNKSGW